jgi:CheY-like chemotaxis protein
MKPPGAPHAGGLRVLVVDDEEDIVEYLKTVLEDNGYQAEGALRAEEALEKVALWRPDLVLLDIMIPEHSGLSLYESIRKDAATSSLPILIISGYARPDEFRKIEDRLLGAAGIPPPDGYLEKPVAVKSLLEAIRRLECCREGGAA